jgi:hypothetical protein
LFKLASIIFKRFMLPLNAFLLQFETYNADQFQTVTNFGNCFYLTTNNI